MLLANPDPENRKMNPGPKRVTSSNIKIFQALPCLMSDVSWKFHENPFNFFFRNVGHRHGLPRKYRKKSCVQGVKWNIPKMCQIVPCTTSHLTLQLETWQNENLFTRLSVMLLTANQRRWKHILRFDGGNKLHSRTVACGKPQREKMVEVGPSSGIKYVCETYEIF